LLLQMRLLCIYLCNIGTWTAREGIGLKKGTRNSNHALVTGLLDP
jgi:hypothetical protein